MSETIYAILRLKPPYDADPQAALTELAAFALETFGEGGNPEATQIEDYVGYVNTPPLGGYIRTRIGMAYGTALEYIEENGGNPIAELIRVEWPALAPEGGYPPIMVDIPAFDEQGQQTGTVSQEIGMII